MIGGRCHGESQTMEWTPPPDGIEMCQGGGNMNATTKEGASMKQVTTIGIDLAKRSFQLHGAGADGLRRVPGEGEP